jgi:hypothetical protein
MGKENTLFDTEEFVDKDKLKARQEEQNPDNLPLIVVHKKSSKIPETPLEKESKKFNKLLKEINDYEASISKLENERKEESILFGKKCMPELVKLGEIKLQFLLLAEKIFENTFFKKKEQQEFCEFVHNFSADVINISDDVADFANKYFNLSITLLSKKQRAKMQNDIFEGFDGEIDIDLDNFDAENFARDTHQKMKEHHKLQEAQEKTKEDITTLSIADLYKTLAKQLHPDLEKDEVIRVHKVKLMQELSEAKNNKDLFAMLRIQMNAAEYLKEDTSQKIFSLDKLKAFNKVLSDKISMYKMQIGRNILNDYYKDKNGFMQSKQSNNFEKMLDKQVKQIKNFTNQVKQDIKSIKNAEDLEIYMMYYSF